MDPIKLLTILRARYKLALLIGFLVLATGMTANQVLPRRYAAEAVVMIDVRSPDPVAALLMPSTAGPASLSTQIDLIRSDRVGRKVVGILGLAQDPNVREAWQQATGGRGKLEDWMSLVLRKGVSVSPARDGSSMINIGYQGADPAFVAAVANAFAQAYIEASVELKVEPARQYSQWFAEQAKVLRENVEKAQGRLSEFQRARGITDEAVENENAKLRELTARLTSVQADIREAQSRQRTRNGDGLSEISPSPTLQGLRSNIHQLEVKLKESAGNLGAKHPQYLRMQAELAELNNRLNIETQRAAEQASSSALARTREGELKAAIEAQSKKLLGMRKDRDELAVLARDVETAKRAYEAVTTRLTQSTLESQATRTNVFVLSPALEPIDPSFPMPFRKILLISLAAALVLAVAVAAGLEMLDRRIRTADDLAQMLQLPVLAVVEPQRIARRRLPDLSSRRVLTGS